MISDNLIETSYEDNLCNVFEELRLKRKTEQDNEKIIYSLLQTKYDLEKSIDEERRNFEKEKSMLEDQIESYKKEISLRDKASECDSKNQQLFNVMFDKEMCSLREELKSMHMIQLNLEKKCREYENTAKIEKSLKDAALKRIAEIQESHKYLKIQHETFKNAEIELKQSVDSTSTLLEERDRTNHHLCDIMSFMGKRIRFLTDELIKSESKLKFIASSKSIENKQSINQEKNIKDNSKILDLSKEINERHSKIFELLNNVLKSKQELVNEEKLNKETKDQEKK